jgi:transcriptional regulator with XRE-family HTH domain
LRALRVAAGLSQEEAGAKLHYNDQKISRFECGQVPGWHSLRAMLDVYGLPVNDWQPYLDLWELASKRGWWRAYGLDDLHYVSMEDQASIVREFHGDFIPGLLQTEPYARAVFSAMEMPRSQNSIDREVTVRMRRQQRLIGDTPLTLHTIINEPVLRQGVSREIMRSQMFRLLRRAELPNVTIQVIPDSAPLHPGWQGSFIVLRFPGDDFEIGYVEHAFGSVHIEGESQVRAARLRFDGLADLALSQSDSLALIDRVVADL